MHRTVSQIVSQSKILPNNFLVKFCSNLLEGFQVILHTEGTSGLVIPNQCCQGAMQLVLHWFQVKCSVRK